MLNNQITVTLDIPIPQSEEELAQIEDVLNTQTSTLVKVWRQQLEFYKELGVTVPKLSVSLTKKKDVKVNPFKETVQELLDHHLKREPNAYAPPQRTAIQRLLETGRTKEELIELYNDSLKEYKLTSWLTVRHKIGKVVTDEDSSANPEFKPVHLDDDAKQSLKERIKTYS